jgi:chromosome segregation ATPase
MSTREELAAKVDELEREVAKLSDDRERRDRLSTRLLGMAEEVRDDVSLRRRHAVATGEKLEKIDARLRTLSILTESPWRSVASE